MKNIKLFNLTGVYYRLKALFRRRKIKKYLSAKEYSQMIDKYAGEKLFSDDECNQYLYNAILSGEPFLACRFGAYELLNLRSEDFNGFLGQKYDNKYHFSKLCNNAGFFPDDIQLLKKFAAIMKDSCKNVDIIGVWFNAFEDYYIKHYMHKPKISYISSLEPWVCPNNPWSAALKGKKVLIIHPFEETIKSQYARREEIFPGTDILPEFELKTLKAVQTCAGENDERFETWFDALDWMYEEALKIDFDVAIVGCGAYGFPLAAKIKSVGKQAIHLAGATQLLFGIMGGRWENNMTISNFYNDSWTRPSGAEIPKNSKNIENACYW